jgi:hypothetical protein
LPELRHYRKRRGAWIIIVARAENQSQAQSREMYIISMGLCTAQELAAMWRVMLTSKRKRNALNKLTGWTCRN